MVASVRFVSALRIRSIANGRRFVIHAALVSLALWLLGMKCIAQLPAASPRTVESATAEMNAAINKVKYIVNDPVTPIRRTPGMRVSTYPMWFHEGVSKPDFNTVEVQKTQELSYEKFEYVALESDPNFVYPGKQLEFNSMTKYFYTDRSAPKKKLSESEMAAINQLYRVIGRCEKELEALKKPGGASAGDAGATTAGGVALLMEKVPLSPEKQKYAVILLVVFVLLLVIYRAVNKRAE
jgi:hypothetical protein